MVKCKQKNKLWIFDWYPYQKHDINHHLGSVGQGQKVIMLLSTESDCLKKSNYQYYVIDETEVVIDRQTDRWTDKWLMNRERRKKRRGKRAAHERWIRN